MLKLCLICSEKNKLKDLESQSNENHSNVITNFFKVKIKFGFKSKVNLKNQTVLKQNIKIKYKKFFY